MDNKENFISFTQYLNIFKKHMAMIITWMCIGIVVAVVVTFGFMTPKYKSTIDLLVNQRTNDVAAQYNVQQADLQAIRTYKDVLTKGVILNDVLKEAKQKDNYTGSIDQLKNDISISNENNSQVISVTVVNKNPYVATDIANMIGDVFTRKIKKIMKVDNVTIVNKATVDTDPVSPRKKLNLALGALVGLMVGLMIAFITEMRDTTINGEEFLVEELGLTILGKVNHLNLSDRDYNVARVVVKDEKDPGNWQDNRRV